MKKLLSLILSVSILFSFSSVPCAMAENTLTLHNNETSEKHTNENKSKRKRVKKSLNDIDERFYKALCKQIDKVDADTEESINKFLKPILDNLLGFKYDPEKDIYYTREDSLQKHFGFGDLYDKFGPFLGMQIDELPIVFKYKHKDNSEKEWLIEFWKGQYGGGLSVGGEIGVYNRLVEEGMEKYVPGKCNYKVFFDSAKGKEKMYLSYVLCDKKGRTIFARNSAEYKKPDGEPKNKDWWLLGIKFGRYGKSEDIVMEAGIRFLSEEMAEKFAEAANQQFPTKIKNLRQKDRIVTFTWE